MIETHTYRSLVRIPWRLRYRRWRQLRKMTPLGRELARLCDEAVERAFIFGDDA